YYAYVQPPPPPGGLLAELPGQPLNLLDRRLDSPIGLPRLRRVAPTNGVTQKVERLVRPTTASCLRFIHRQLQSGHHGPQRSHRLVGGAPTTDHESSSPGEFHPQAHTEPDGKLALHPALIT